jgi:hypothetical protein
VFDGLKSCILPLTHSSAPLPISWFNIWSAVLCAKSSPVLYAKSAVAPVSLCLAKKQVVVLTTL